MNYTNSLLVQFINYNVVDPDKMLIFEKKSYPKREFCERCLFVGHYLYYFNLCMWYLYRLFMEILSSCVDCDEIQFKEDGNWAPMRSKKVVQEVSASSNGIEGISTKIVTFMETEIKRDSKAR